MTNKTVTLASIKEYFQTVLRDDESRAKAQLARYRQELDKNPSHALAWGEGAFSAAASLDVIQAFRYDLEVAVDFQQLKWGVEQRALAGAFDTSNHGLHQVLSKYHAREWANYANTLRGFHNVEPTREEPTNDPA
jgi:hypothetical protein